MFKSHQKLFLSDSNNMGSQIDLECPCLGVNVIII